MGSFLQEYGRLIIAVIIASFLSMGIFIVKASCDGILDSKIFNSKSMTYIDSSRPDINSLVSGKAPELTVQRAVALEQGKELDPKDVVISAYGSTDFSSYVVPKEKSNSIASIKRAIIAGKVNIVYPEDYDCNTPGTYTVYFYVKNTTSDGLWTKKVCKILI